MLWWDMETVFKEVRVEKVSDKIVTQLIDLITEGQLLPGEKLPSERRLTDLFGVGRSSLREALNIVIEEGLMMTVMLLFSCFCRNVLTYQLQ